MSTPMRVLVAHNAYQHRGGEDSVMDAEVELLRQHGHTVEIFSRHNDEIGGKGKVGLAVDTLWSASSARDLRTLLRKFSPEVIHVHNTFPLISPSLYWAAVAEGVPVVQTLHNFRFLCPQAMFLREGNICEDCLGHLPWRGAVRGCYRNSRTQSAVLAGMLSLHRGLGTYRHKIARYIALNDFCRRKFIEGGLPADRIAVKGNFVDVSECSPLPRSGGLFVGRLSVEKGTGVLAEALSQLREVQVDVVGAGPEEYRMSACGGVRLLGFRSQDEIIDRMRKAAYLVMPSVWYENFPRTLVEAFACGLPVIASRLGALAELVVEGETGLLFEPGSAVDLAQRIAWAEAHPGEMQRMGRNARRIYEAKYTPSQNYQELMSIYQAAIQTGTGKGVPALVPGLEATGESL